MIGGFWCRGIVDSVHGRIIPTTTDLLSGKFSRWGWVMASGAATAGKAAAAAQPPGPPGSTVNGTAAEFPKIEPVERFDDQLHNKMCKKIAQLTKVRRRCPVPSTYTRHGEIKCTLQDLCHLSRCVAQDVLANVSFRLI